MQALWVSGRAKCHQAGPTHSSCSSMRRAGDQAVRASRMLRCRHWQLPHEACRQCHRSTSGSLRQIWPLPRAAQGHKSRRSNPGRCEKQPAWVILPRLACTLSPPHMHVQIPNVAARPSHVGCNSTRVSIGRCHMVACASNTHTDGLDHAPPRAQVPSRFLLAVVC